MMSLKELIKSVDAYVEFTEAVNRYADLGHHTRVKEALLGTEKLVKLLSISKCPDTKCINGMVPVPLGGIDWEAQQCQFCAEKAEILIKFEGKENEST